MALAARGSARSIVFGLVFVVATGAAACGSSSQDSGRGTSATVDPATQKAAFRQADVQVRAVDIDFPQKEFTARAGKVTIAYVDEGRIRHTLVLDGVSGWKKLVVDKHGDVASETITLDPGTYTMYCDVPGHRRAGMEATLRVEG